MYTIELVHQTHKDNSFNIHFLQKMFKDTKRVIPNFSIIEHYTTDYFIAINMYHNLFNLIIKKILDNICF